MTNSASSGSASGGPVSRAVSRDGAQPSRQPDGGTRRAQILDAAAALFARRGFHGVSMDDIGGAVGMSGPGLYRHFSGKTAVLTEMLLRISERLAAEGGSRAAAAADAPAALDALLRGHIDFALGQPALITVHDRELGNVPEPARRRIRRLQRLYVEEWVTVLTEMVPHAGQPTLRAAVHAVFGLLNSTPHSAGEIADADFAELLYAMARASLMSAATAAEGAPARWEFAADGALEETELACRLAELSGGGGGRRGHELSAGKIERCHHSRRRGRNCPWWCPPTTGRPHCAGRSFRSSGSGLRRLSRSSWPMTDPPMTANRPWPNSATG